MTPEEKTELERLRKFAADSLLSMSQVDWLIGLIDRQEQRLIEANDFY